MGGTKILFLETAGGWHAYEGHYFWDTELYLLPFLTYTLPRIARNLLAFRYKMLPQALARAKQLGHRGAMFPWRTISGEEASAYYAAGTAIGNDFLREYGAEMLVETARLWLDLGFYSDAKGGSSASTASPAPMSTRRS
jgi:alpha,alpha-trehalose phosphorylase